ncbi:hypothetical protein [Novosphingobium sp. JCM 18896]|uniref:hypothetical protein n=1 Tax=Novosphingobium sp. JCM 18896 TaxID=2989731 RepID=UPI002223838D|nr:hypothetical protein [Novosphingobium sp. JCM 18896]MCW1432339.1 hypothetical protein [Novosphingobium sp. JCM 18896]
MPDKSEDGFGAVWGMQRVLLLASPRDFCIGADRTIEAVEHAFARHGSPVFARRTIFRNGAIVGEVERSRSVFLQRA